MPERTNAFVNEGQYWTIQYGGASFRLRDTKGLQYIAALLRSPGQEVHVLDLASGRPARGESAAIADDLHLDTGDTGDVLDPQAKASYRRRLIDLRQEAEEAEEFNDPERAYRARSEIDALEQQLTAAFGLGGRARKTGSAAERARVNVRNSIASSLRTIATHDSALAEHLKKAIRTGTFCWYAGDGAAWRTQAGTAPDPAGDPPAAGVGERLLATFLLTDLVDSTRVAARRGERDWRGTLDQHGAVVRDQLAAHGGRLVTLTGGEVFALFDSPASAIGCALGLHVAVGGLGLKMRAGVHTGECLRRGDEISGMGLHVAQRIMAEGKAGDILVSSTVRDIVEGSGIALRDHGFRALGGVPGTWRLFAVSGETHTRRRRARDDQPVPLSLMIVDDHPMWRQTLRTVLEGSGVGIVVAEASDGQEAVDTAIAARPEAVVMDMNLISVDGVTATRRILEVLPETKVLMLSSSDERDDVVAAVHAGASGYLLKTAGPEEVADAVERVRAGEVVFPPALAKVVLDEFRRRGEPRKEPATKSRNV